MAQLARDLEDKGHNIISLSLGEPDFDTPYYIKESAIKALKEGYTKYTPVPGLNILREKISEKFKIENNLNYSRDQIVVSNGAKQSLANIAQALINPGDEAIILAPYWVSYDAIVKMAGGTPVIVKAGVEQEFKVTADQIEQAIGPKTKFILFSSPCNPTGSVYSKMELEKIAQMMSKYPDIMIVSDEIYEYITFKEHHVSIGSIPSVAEQVITVNGFSKGFAMTGWRLGYMGAPEWLAKACSKIQGQFTSGATSFGQKAAADILLSDKTEVHQMKAAFLKRRDLILELLSDFPGIRLNVPEGAFYVLPDISYYFDKTHNEQTIKNSDDLSDYLLKEAHVAVVPGSAFGAEECIRISYASSEENLKEASSRIKIALKKLH
jgi:aspartate aminotransferase